MKEDRNLLVKALKRHRIDAELDKGGWLHITCYMKHGEEKSVEIPPDVDCVRWMDSELENVDESYDAYIWLDEFGHGKDGAPHDMEDVLADQQQWTRTRRRVKHSMRVIGVPMAHRLRPHRQKGNTVLHRERRVR